MTECRTIRFVSVSQQIARCSVPGKGLGHLARKPDLRGISSDFEVNNPSAIEAEHNQGIKQLECRGGDEHVNRRKVGQVVAQKAPPGRGGDPGPPRHPSSNRGLADLEAEIPQRSKPLTDPAEPDMLSIPGQGQRMPFDRLKRREFISLLGGAAAAWPLAASAQQSRVPTIGFISSDSPDGYAQRLRGFRQGLKEAGYVEGENVAIAYRWAEGQIDRLPALATELVRQQVAVVVAPGSITIALAIKEAISTIPVVFLVGADPVKFGLVASLARPGGNMTGVNIFAQEITTKRLHLLHELLPSAVRVAMLLNPTSGGTESLEAAAGSLGLGIQIYNASTSREIDAAFSTFIADRPDALFVAGDLFFNSRRVQLVHLASHHHLPTAYSTRSYSEIGGLMSYGPDVPDAYRQVGIYAGRILKGAKPADLPVVQATRFELVINHQTARMQGIAVPDKLLALADEVIE
jgi:putative tryptophan/tyrosine transport system substrate-binding protein